MLATSSLHPARTSSSDSCTRPGVSKCSRMGTARPRRPNRPGAYGGRRTGRSSERTGAGTRRSASWGEAVAAADVVPSRFGQAEHGVEAVLVGELLLKGGVVVVKQRVKGLLPGVAGRP